MKRLAIAFAALAAITGTAVAADLPVRAPVYKAPAPAPIVRSWTGCYIAAGGGYGMYNQDVSSWVEDGTVTLGGRGWFGTAGGGCDFQVAGSWVIGAFGDFDFSSIKGHLGNLVDDEKLSWSWSAGGRIGFVALPDLLTYFSGGYTQAHFDQINAADSVCGGTGCYIQANTYHGWFLGSGYEYRLVSLGMPSLAWKTEYRFADYSTKDLIGCDSTGCDSTPLGTAHKYVQTIRSQLVWRFDFGGY